MTQKETPIIDNTDKILNDDLVIDKELETFISKKILTKKDFEKINNMTYNKQVVLFRQRSLRGIAERSKKDIPSTFTQSELIAIQNIHKTRYRGKQKDLITKLRHEEAIQLSKQKLISSTRNK
jgi:hypothetical protein